MVLNPPLQAFVVEMDAKNEQLGWLNKHAPQILGSQSVSPQIRDRHVGKVRAINLNWSRVRALRHFRSFMHLWSEES